MADSTFEWTNDELSGALERALAEGRDPSDALAAVGEYMVGSIQETFSVGGRPENWAPWSDNYAAWRETHRPNKGVLHFDELLSASINFQLHAAGVETGTNVKYAAIHQFGGETGSRDGRFIMEARPFVQFLDEDVAVIEDILTEWAFGSLGVN
ncbi:phage virion morphogenesis protein [bacterium]|nr:phage virion morphogenesis protein [bacterium]